MTLQEIHARLRERFGDAIQDWQAPETGDACIRVATAALHEVCAALRDEEDLRFDFLRLISSVDRTECLSSVYHLYSYVHNHEAVLRVDVDRGNPRVASVTDLWPSAEWHEREAFDMMGILYEGNPNLKRILLPDDWAGYPLRKDYVTPKEYNGLTNE